jgi:beta-glucosidase-like glycosyl hydrolase
VLAIEAGCDALLICAGDYDVQAAALEAIVRRAEQDRAFEKRVEDAVHRNTRLKERFLAAPSAAPLSPAALGRVLGQDAHRRTADAMARFA